jgi:hypothetical protein
LRKSQVPYTYAKLFAAPSMGLVPKHAVNNYSPDARPCRHRPHDRRLGGEHLPGLGIDQIHVAGDEMAAADRRLQL